jgi:hypothetical protein
VQQPAAAGVQQPPGLAAGAQLPPAPFADAQPPVAAPPGGVQPARDPDVLERVELTKGGTPLAPACHGQSGTVWPTTTRCAHTQPVQLALCACEPLASHWVVDWCLQVTDVAAALRTAQWRVDHGVANAVDAGVLHHISPADVTGELDAAGRRHRNCILSYASSATTHGRYLVRIADRPGVKKQDCWVLVARQRAVGLDYQVVRVVRLVGVRRLGIASA